MRTLHWNNMNIELYEGPATGIEAETLVLFAFDDEPDPTLNQTTGGWVQELYQSKEFSGKPCENVILHRPSGYKAKRLVLAGAGKRESFDQVQMRRSAGIIVRSLKNKSLQNLHFVVDGFVQAAVEGAILGDYEPDSRKTVPDKICKRLSSLTICVEKKEDRHQEEVHHGQLIAEAQNFSRFLKNEPANHLTPQ
ncbi:MAG: M17 family peptidase N-terminal domain-containing protein, partial [Bryobacteraceae bacterium]